jgi:hypothetical protein
MERTREVALGISGIRPRREGVRGVAYERLVWLEELPLLSGDPPTWLSRNTLLKSGPQKARRGKFDLLVNREISLLTPSARKKHRNTLS